MNPHSQILKGSVTRDHVPLVFRSQCNAQKPSSLCHFGGECAHGRSVDFIDALRATETYGGMLPNQKKEGMKFKDIGG